MYNKWLINKKAYVIHQVYDMFLINASKFVLLSNMFPIVCVIIQHVSYSM